MRRSSPVGTMALVAALLSSCTLTHEQNKKAPAATPEPVMTSAWQTELQPLGAVSNIGETAILFAKQGNRFRITALDPGSGKILWSDRASPAYLPPYVPISMASVDGKVAYYQEVPGKDRYSRLVIADPRTGKELAISERRAFSENIEVCDDDPKAVCMKAWPPGSTRQQLYRFSVVEPRLTIDRRPPPPAGSRGVSGHGLVDLGTRNPEKLARVEAGRVVWSRPLADIFGKGLSTDGGWSFSDFEKADVFTGSVGSSDFKAKTEDLTELVTAGFSMSTGEPLWRELATYVDCLQSTRIELRDGDTVPLRCRYTGTETFGSGGRRKGKGVTVVLEKYDVRTGKAVWSTPIGSAPVQALLVGTEGGAPLIDDRHLVVDTGRSTVIVDLDTGRTTPAGATTQAWCQRDSSLEYPYPVYRLNGSKRYTVRGESTSFPCDLLGKETAQPMTTMPSSVTSFKDGTVVYASPAGVSALKRQG